MKNKWLLKDKAPEQLFTELPEVPRAVVQVLYARGYTSADEIKRFLEAEYGRESYHGSRLPDIEAGIDRVKQAIEKGEQITVFADYDADAVTAAAVMIRALRFLGAKVDYYIPDRFAEGYGMSVPAIEQIAERQTNLIVTVDCGITSVDEVARAKELGMDVVITDHHHLPEKLPAALAVINPQRGDTDYDGRYLTGVGVAFKFVEALIDKHYRDLVPEGREKWLLDLVAIGTVADCQDLVAENRILVKYGLVVLNKTKWPGLKALLSVVKADPSKPLDTFSIGFQIAPRINAAGRVAHADVALKLLLTDDDLEAVTLSNQLEELNRKRQQLTEGVISEAREQIEAQVKDKKILFAYGRAWPKGVVGLVAGRLTEEYKRPVLVASVDNNLAFGSARSIADFNIVEAISYAKDHAVKFGGHAGAAGFTVESHKIDDFYRTICGFAEVKLSPESLEGPIEVDAELQSPQDFTVGFAEALGLLEPFGQGFLRPLFLIRNLEVKGLKAVGKEGRHVQLSLGNDKIPGTLRCIAFNKPFLIQALETGDRLDLVGEVSVNEWNNNKYYQLKLTDWEKTINKSESN